MISEKRQEEISEYIDEKFKKYIREPTHIWLAISGTVLIVSTAVVMVCSNLGVDPITLWDLIDWPLIGASIVPVAVMIGGFALLCLAFIQSPDERRAIALAKQDAQHQAELDAVYQQGFDLGYTRGQSEGIRIRIAEQEVEEDDRPTALIAHDNPATEAVSDLSEDTAAQPIPLRKTAVV